MREIYDETRNVIWQQRAGEPTTYENAVGDALEKIFAEEVYDLPGIVARLNEMKLKTESGDGWTEENFQVEIDRLGRKEFG